MLFNSIDFAVFLPIVFALYWFVAQRNLKQQNLLIVVASYLFYGWWDYRFLALIAFSTIVDFTVGGLLEKARNQRERKMLLWSSIAVNLGFLGFFKYYNFFVESFVDAFSLAGWDFQASTLRIVLPVGISFYTFQTLSYTVDVYKRKLEPTRDLIAFTAFVSFFPQLVAGPIERASNLLPQFYKERTFNYAKATDGFRQILWGLFKKVVIADTCAEYANYMFENSAELGGLELALGAVFFAFQIYGDFSGYSDIAIGTARLFGFNLMQNFAFPFFSRDIAEFWRRWHISLSTWFRDYLYIPLGGSKGGTGMRLRNTFIIFVVSGFWHGANWTFIVWGALNALYMVPLMLTRTNRNNLEIVAAGRWWPSIRELGAMGLTFGLTVFAFAIFRAESMGHAVEYFSHMFGNWDSFLDVSIYMTYKRVFALLGLFILAEWLGRADQYAIEKVLFKVKLPVRYAVYYLIVFAVLWYSGKDQQFIYFQF